ncbi:GNAT family N-acetyltransferase [Lacinutrix jangbogonensis]|uniref:GNAT family N-acetyltransferase n=1 Tax=Lacinutrix jangbogonensis TaxID=1469557 RepID=UPI00053E18E3|nr:GNAT family protein [Lacinutrix jangbogonensis]
MKIKILKSNIQLENDSVLLLPFDNERNEELKEIIFDKEIWQFMGSNINNEQGLKNYIAKTIKDKNNRLCYPFLIIDKETNKVAGCTRFGNVNTADKKCEIGWTWYGTEFQGTGLNKACKYELLQFGFETIGFKRIQFSVDNKNIRSQKAIEKLGAQREGVFRNNNVAPNGDSRTDIYYSIIKEEWESIKAEIFPEFLIY